MGNIVRQVGLFLLFVVHVFWGAHVVVCTYFWDAHVVVCTYFGVHIFLGFTCFGMHMFWDAPILEFTCFGMHMFWDSPVLRCTCFGVHMFWGCVSIVWRVAANMPHISAGMVPHKNKSQIKQLPIW